MKAVRISGHKPELIEAPVPSGTGVVVKVAAASICGSDLHMMDKGYAEDTTPGHEFSGYTPDGTAVTAEPLLGCGRCGYCEQGYTGQCDEGVTFIGIGRPGAMAEFVEVPAKNIVPLPSGLDVRHGCLVEPIAVAVHGLDQVAIRPRERVLVIGAGPIGLAAAAALQARGMPCDITARHPHQQAAAQRLGASLEAGDGYDVVIDAVGSSDSVKESIRRCRNRGRIGMLGSFWDPVAVPMSFCAKELRLISAMTYRCHSSDRSFLEAARIVFKQPQIAEVFLTHRFPLDGAAEAFVTAADRASGAIKVAFEP